jgi:UDP-N-acetylglucosamine 2-epimerase
MAKHLKILNIVGARPNLPKMGPHTREMGGHPEIAPILAHTGQHYDEKLSDIFFRQMGIPSPQVNLEVRSDFLCLLSKATMVLTDSGGIQGETTALGVPCLTLRENTERPITISQGTNLLVGTDPSKIVAAAQEVLAGNSKAGRIPPSGMGRRQRESLKSCSG